MNRATIALAAVFIFFADAAAAQEPKMPAPEGARYTFAPVQDGQLRLDTQTGDVSICHRRNGGWVCEAVADDRRAYEAEIKRLRDRIAALEAGRDQRMPLPSDAEVDRAMNFLEKMLRRFMAMVDNLRRESEAK